jgi:hypothetical protein
VPVEIKPFQTVLLLFKLTFISVSLFLFCVLVLLLSACLLFKLASSLYLFLLVCSFVGRLYACLASRPGQSGRADGYILEGPELLFYIKKMQKKKTK